MLCYVMLCYVYTMFLNTLSFLSSRNINDQVSHPYNTTGKIIVPKGNREINLLKSDSDMNVNIRLHLIVMLRMYGAVPPVFWAIMN